MSPTVKKVVGVFVRFRAPLHEQSMVIMITGESGSGKELVAVHCTGIHRAPTDRLSPSTPLPFPRTCWKVSCLATSAVLSRVPKPCGVAFEQAEGGTLFLDEIGDMPFDLQTRLLRVLSDGSFYRVVGTAVKTNVRVIAATHQNLEERSQNRQLP
jgi:two-component system nitrogen regulation response regulator GlnG